MYETKVIHKDEDCKITLEELDGKLFVHVGLFKFSRPVLEKLLIIWATIKAKCYYLGYEAIYTYTRDPRIVKFFPNGEELGDYEYQGQNYKVFQWVLN